MSIESISRNFQELIQKIETWPSAEIRKEEIVRLLDEFAQQNFESESIYDHVIPPALPEKHSRTLSDSYSRLDPTDLRGSQVSISSNTSNASFHQSQLSTTETHSSPLSVRKESKPSVYVPSSKTIIEHGELVVKKNSTILSPLMKKLGLKTVYCELATLSNGGDKFVYFTVFEKQKSQKIVHKFHLSDSCLFASEGKREFLFKHDIGTEHFETGSAERWISAFNSEVVIEPESEYEIGHFVSTPKTVEAIPDAPGRPPPRPTHPIKSINPEQIFVCLYDHKASTGTDCELEFHRGDLLYVVNTEGPNFYIAHKLVLPWNPDHQPAPGVVFKEYIHAAYAKAF